MLPSDFRRESHPSASFLKEDKRNSGEGGELVAEVVPRSTDWHGD